MPRHFRKKAAKKQPKKQAQKRPRRKMRMPRYPSIIRYGQLPNHSYSTHTFADVITIADATTESAGFLQYFANTVDTVAGTPSGVYSTRSSTPGTNDPFSALRTDPVPRGYDTMSALYEKCRIYASSISVQYMNQEAAGTGNIAVCLYNSDADQSFSVTTADEVIGNTIPGFKYRGAYPVRGVQSAPLLKKSWSEKRMTKEERMQNEYEVGVNTVDGSAAQYFNIALVNMFGTTSEMAGRLIVRISYHCKWSDPKSFAADDAP